MIIDGAANLKFVYLEGEMTLKDIQNIMMYQNTSMNVGGNVYRIVDGTLDLADLGVLDGLKGLESLQGLEGLKSLESLYNPQIQISAESETKRSIFREKDKTKRSKKESAQHSKSRNKSFVMTSVSAL